MRTIIAAICMLCLAICVQAQTVTKSKITGRWKISAIQIHGKEYSLSNKANIERGMYSMASAKGHKLTSTDSSLMLLTADMLYGVLHDMQFEFRSNDTAYIAMTMTIGGESQKVADSLYYSIQDSKLNMNWTMSRKDEIELSMPDPQTLFFVNFAAAQGCSLIFKRR